jgi:DNA-binding CsgD family transcriptional regulator
VASKVEQSYARRLAELPSETQLMLLIAAAEPLGDPALLHQASEALGLDFDAARPAVDAGLIKLGVRVEFAHPLVRSATYRSASEADRYRVHRALADATDPATDPDRRAWHRAWGTAGPDEDVAAELERSAGRAHYRGGAAAAAAFLQRAATLTPDSVRRADRVLAAAQASLEAGSFDAAGDLVATAASGPLDEMQMARADLLSGQISFASSMGSAAPQMLLEAAGRLERLDIDLARETYLDAWGSALFAGRLATAGNLLEVSLGALSAPTPTSSQRPSDLLLDSLALLVSEGPAASAPALRRATSAFVDDPPPNEETFRWGWMTTIPSNVLWDENSWHAINARQVSEARIVGALARLPIDLTAWAILVAWRGAFADAAGAIAEAEGITDATGTRFAPYASLLLAAWRGREDVAVPMVESVIREATVGGQGIGVQWAEWVNSILYNGLGRYTQALVSAQRATEEMPQLFISMWAIPELIEAAVHNEMREVALAALERLAEVTAAAGTEWGLGIQARSRALMSDGTAADELYREAIDRLGQTQLRTELARAHLLYGEWLRREHQRVDARDHLRTAHNMLVEIGMEAFAERARRELVATGGTVRKRRDETPRPLTTQEEQIAWFARDGLSNAEIAAKLFISPRTVDFHMRKIFAKIGISSRRQLWKVLSEASRPNLRP